MQPMGREYIPAPFLPPGRPKAKSAPLGDETIQCNMMMSAARGHGSQAPVDQDDGTME
jgi:hypothetical protein